MQSAAVSAGEQAALGAAPQLLLIGGEWRASASGETVTVEDPATGAALCQVPDATPGDARAALDAAAAAQASWSAHPPRERGEILRRAFELVMARTESLALLMTLEMGKPLAESRAEVAYGAEFLRWFSEEAVRIDGGYSVAPNGRGRMVLMRQPVGPCLLITPWNFPMAMGARKIGPAVAAGCTMVVKPAQQTPLSMFALARILEESGLPPGVLNVITASRAATVATPLLADPRLRKLSFTGSTEVGRRLLAQAAERVLRTSMELGGNAPFVVFDDADVEAAVDGAMIAKMRNMGEACTAANRFHVAAGVADEFATRLAKRMGELRMGRGTEPDVNVGPLIDAPARSKVGELVDEARSRGARVLVGGVQADGPGYFYPPTVLDRVSPDVRAFREEIFGPVAPVASFTSEEAALAAANDSEHGLVAYVYTRDLDRAIRFCERLESGMVGLNQGLVSNPAAPFGGIKQSGLGREGGREGILEYLNTKYVAVAT